MLSERRIENGLAKAVRHFWTTRDGQSRRQLDSGRSDMGSRGAVTGGKQMDGFVAIVQDINREGGLPNSCVYSSTRVELPGYFRPEKKWDLVIVDDGIFVAAIEFKSQIGPSFGNNFNNRSEEAIGSAQDIWTAYREGAYSMLNRPWLGYLMLLEDCPRSTSPVTVREPHFPVFPEFAEASYSQRYQVLLTKLVRERLYDSACFVLSSRHTGPKGLYSIPNANLSFVQLAVSLSDKIKAHINTKQRSRSND